MPLEERIELDDANMFVRGGALLAPLVWLLFGACCAARLQTMIRRAPRTRDLFA